MDHSVWAIKLGSGGICIPFCKQHSIVGVGWRMVDADIVRRGDRDELNAHVRSTCNFYNGDARKIGGATGQLLRFGCECKQNDYILYYDPPEKCVQICRVSSDHEYRDFNLDDDTDIWHYRVVEYPCDPIPILDFYGQLKGSLLGPRMSFWSMGSVYQIVDQIARGESPHIIAATDPAFRTAWDRLTALVFKRLEVLDWRDWEWLVVDYVKALGATVDEQHVGGNLPVIDVQAWFDHGGLGREDWRIQVRRRRESVGRQEVEQSLGYVGEARLCYVSVAGFTEEARVWADKNDVVLLESGDFVHFVLGGRVRTEVREKLKLPNVLSST